MAKKKEKPKEVLVRNGNRTRSVSADDLLPVYALGELVNATKKENVEVVFGKFRFSIGERMSLKWQE